MTGRSNRLQGTPLLGFVAWSGSGKTTLLTRLIPQLRQRGLCCGVVKHSHHDVEVDVPGKDSYRLREAGASQVLLASPYRRFWVEEGDGETEPQLAETLAGLAMDRLDLVLVEGFRHAAMPKIEIHRPICGMPLLCREDTDVFALATDGEPAEPCDLPRLPLNDAGVVADFILAWMAGLGGENESS